jgi:RNA polymerase sigma-70 factor (ECF subfamily)
MAESPITRPTLLVRLRDPGDADAWRDLVELYGPLVYRFGRKRGLQDADAADLTQAVLGALAQAIRRFDYDPRRGTFRAWLFRIVRNQLGKLLAQRQRQPDGAGGTSVQERLQEEPEPDHGEADLWEQEHRRQRFLWAAERVRADFEESSWRAFWQTAVEGRSAADVAGELGLSVGAIYTAKSRVLDRIKRVLDQAPED